MTRGRAVVGATALTAVTCVLVWALAYPVVPLWATVVRAVADGAAVVTLGLAVVPWLDTDRHRAELRHRAAAPLVMVSAVWLTAELMRAVLSAAEAAGAQAWTVGWRTAWEFAVSTAAGRAALLTLAAAALVIVVAVLVPPSPPAGVVTLGAAAVGLVGHPLTGHLAHDPVGSLAVLVHVLAAALWCGGLAAVVSTVEHRGRWSRVLPRFSQMSLWCVVALLVGGSVAAVVQLGSAAALFTTGYGRILTAKLVCTVVLAVLAWRHRTVWVPAARGHRSPAQLSRRRAYGELSVMWVAVAAAAALAVAG
ncbi:copper resistance D family protein [Mycobacterium sp. SMC-4]|uniref:copper resistance D family protein n=1 Tax=Mycobacterium sp. SMC-4 TaxID=2857059 RepID=UPI003CFFC497